MSHRSRTILLAVCLVALLVSARGDAQAPAEGTVTGQGSAEVKRPPDVLRVQVEMLAKGTDLAQALARLKERREAAQVHLKALAAVPESIHFGAPALSSEKTEQQKQMEAMVLQRMRGAAGPKAAKKKEAPPAVVGAVLRFDLPLKAGSADELLIAAQALQQRVKEADLGGLKDFEKLSPQEEELAEEAQAMMGGQPQAEPKRGEPGFLFVCKLSDADLDRAAAEAFQKARRHAEQLARAAGARLGPLHRLDSAPLGMPVELAVSAGYNPYNAARVAENLPAALPAEASAPQPGPVTYRVALTAAFLLRPGKE